MTGQKLRHALCCPDAPHLALGLCSTHYQKRKAWKNGVRPSAPQECDWLDALVEQARGEKKQRAVTSAVTRRADANAKRTVDKGHRKYTTKYRYGVTQEYIERLRDKQGGKCAICGKEGPLYIDHCHTTNVVRGLLCPGCNTMLGVIETRGHLLPMAKEYIEARNTGKDDRPNT
jgi:hypothetical protein